MRYAALAFLFFAANLFGQNSPYRLANGSEIRISGTVQKAGASAFTLNYGRGAIVVEMDDYDQYKEGYNILKGDKVVVTGKIDADAGETRTIEASSVFIPKLDLTVKASSVDDEDVKAKAYLKTLKDGAAVELRGIIRELKGDSFILQSSQGLLEVQLNKVAPADRIALRIGQAVFVKGTFDNRFFRKDAIVAQTIQNLRVEKQ